MEYTVIETKGKSLFIAEVNSYIQAGWTPLGGVCVSADGAGIWFYQAMTRNSSET